MAALRSLQTPPSPNKRKVRRHRPRQKNQQERALMTEISLKLLFNGVLSFAAMATLINLIPYQWLQQQKLKEVRVEIQDTETRVNELRERLSRNFDPQQSRKIMQEQSPMIDPSQRRIILVEQEGTPVAQQMPKNEIAHP